MAASSPLKKLLLIGAGGFALLLVALLTVPLWFNVDHYRPEIEKQLSETLHRKVTLGQLRLHILPLPTLSLASIEIGDDPAFGAGPIFASKGASIRIALFSLLKKPLRIDSISVNDGVLNVREDRRQRLNLSTLIAGIGEPAPKGQAVPAEAPSVSLMLSSLSLRHCVLNYEPAGQPKTSLPIDLTLSGFGASSSRLDLTAGKTRFLFSGKLGANGPKGEFTADGDLTIPRGDLGGFIFTDFKSQVKVTPELAHFNAITAKSYSGSFTADAKVMIAAGRFSFGAKLTHLDLGACMKSVTGAATVTGTAELAANGEGPLSQWDAMTGYAKLDARDGIVSHFDLIDKINRAFSLTGLSQVSDRDLHYSSLTGDFKLGGGGAHTGNLHALSQIMEVTGAGDIWFANRLAIKGDAHLTQSRSAEMTHGVNELNNLLDAENRLLIPYSATGPADNPSINIDSGALLKNAGTAVVKKKAADYLGGLLGGKKKSSP